MEEPGSPNTADWPVPSSVGRREGGLRSPRAATSRTAEDGGPECPSLLPDAGRGPRPDKPDTGWAALHPGSEERKAQTRGHTRRVGSWERPLLAAVASAPGSAQLFSETKNFSFIAKVRSRVSPESITPNNPDATALTDTGSGWTAVPRDGPGARRPPALTLLLFGALTSFGPQTRPSRKQTAKPGRTPRRTRSPREEKKMRSSPAEGSRGVESGEAGCTQVSPAGEML